METIGRADAHDPVVDEADEEMHKQVWETAVQARPAHMWMNLYVTDLVAGQQEDTILKTAIKWILSQKVQDMKHLLGVTQTQRKERLTFEGRKS